jgi:uncharacterized membrane protein
MAEKSPSNSPLREDKQFLIAIAFIAGFFILMSISLVQYFVSANLEAVKLVGAVFGGWVGAIIGFYFGQKPVEQVKQTLDAERQTTKDLTKYITDRSTDMWAKFEKKKEEK